MAAKCSFTDSVMLAAGLHCTFHLVHSEGMVLVSECVVCVFVCVCLPCLYSAERRTGRGCRMSREHENLAR